MSPIGDDSLRLKDNDFQKDDEALFLQLSPSFKREDEELQSQ